VKKVRNVVQIFDEILLTIQRSQQIDLTILNIRHLTSTLTYQTQHQNMKLNATALITALAIHEANAAFTFPTHRTIACRSPTCNTPKPRPQNSNNQHLSQHQHNMVRSIFQEIDDFFDDYMRFPSSIFEPDFSRASRTLAAPSSSFPSKAISGTGMELRRSSPRYDIMEGEDVFKVSIDVPGIKASDIKIEYKPADRILHVSGGRKRNEGGKLVETFFEKHFRIANNIDVNNISANIADGVLVLSLPKDEESNKVHKIAVTEGVSDAVGSGDVDIALNVPDEGEEEVAGDVFLEEEGPEQTERNEADADHEKIEL